MRAVILGAIALLSSVGCYSVEPMATLSPTPGTRVELAINDGGRVALGGSMGPQIRRVEGQLLEKQDSTYVLSVIGVNYLDGGFQKWSGETVRISSSMFSGLFEKRFSKGRTIAFIVGAAAATALVTSRGWSLKPSLPEEPEPLPPSTEARYPLPIRIRLIR